MSRYSTAAAFFILAGRPDSAVSTVLDNLHDPMLALTVARLRGASDSPSSIVAPRGLATGYGGFAMDAPTADDADARVEGDDAFDDSAFGGGWGDAGGASSTTKAPEGSDGGSETGDDVADAPSKSVDLVARVLEDHVAGLASSSGDVAMQAMTLWLRRHCVESVALLVGRAVSTDATPGQLATGAVTGAGAGAGAGAGVGEDADGSDEGTAGAARAVDEAELLLFGRYLSTTVRMRQQAFVQRLVAELAGQGVHVPEAVAPGDGGRDGIDTSRWHEYLQQQWGSRLCKVFAAAGLPLAALPFAKVRSTRQHHRYGCRCQRVAV